MGREINTLKLNSFQVLGQTGSSDLKSGNCFTFTSESLKKLKKECSENSFNQNTKIVFQAVATLKDAKALGAPTKNLSSNHYKITISSNSIPTIGKSFGSTEKLTQYVYKATIDGKIISFDDLIKKPFFSKGENPQVIPEIQILRTRLKRSEANYKKLKNATSVTPSDYQKQIKLVKTLKKKNKNLKKENVSLNEQLDYLKEENVSLNKRPTHKKLAIFSFLFAFSGSVLSFILTKFYLSRALQK